MKTRLRNMALILCVCILGLMLAGCATNNTKTAMPLLPDDLAINYVMDNYHMKSCTTTPGESCIVDNETASTINIVFTTTDLQVHTGNFSVANNRIVRKIIDGRLIA